MVSPSCHLPLRDRNYGVLDPEPLLFRSPEGQHTSKPQDVPLQPDAAHTLAANQAVIGNLGFLMASRAVCKHMDHLRLYMAVIE